MSIIANCIYKNHQKKALQTATLFVLFFAFYPTYVNFAYGQVSLFLLLALTLSWKSFQQGKPFSAGLWLGFITALKPFFAIFIIASTATQNRKLTKGLIESAAALTTLSLLCFGWTPFSDYLKVASDVTWTSSNWNASLTGFFQRLLGGSENTPWINAPVLAKILVLTASVGLIAIHYISLRKATLNRATSVRTALYPLTVLVMLLVSPLGWIYYFPLLATLLPWIIDAESKSPPIRTYTIITAACIITMCIPREIEYSHEMNSIMSWWWEGPLYTYTLAILYFTLLQSARTAKIEGK